METFLTDSYNFKVDLNSQLNLSAIVNLPFNDSLPLIIDLCRYVLLCCVTCSNKQEAVQHILDLEESMQHELMLLINTSMEMFQPGGIHYDKPTLLSPKTPSGNNTSFFSNNNDKAHDDSDLRSQLDTVTRELRELKIIHHNTCEQLNLVTSDMENKLTSVTASTQQELTSQHEMEINKLKKLLERTEAISADSINAAQTAMESAETRATVLEQDVNSKLREIRSLQDELDLVRDKVKAVTQYENTIARLKAKLDETNDYQRQLQSSEAFASEKLARVAELETELQKLNVQKNSLQKYKDQALSLEVEVAQLKDSLSLKTNECLKFRNLSDEQSSKIRELTFQTESFASKPEVNNLQVQSLSTTLSNDTALQNQILTLQTENKKLREDWERMALLEEELDATTKRYELAKAQIASSSKTIQECNEKIAELEARPVEANPASVANIEAMAAKIAKLQSYEQVSRELSEQNMTLHADVLSLQEAVKTLNHKYLDEREKTDSNSSEASTLKAQLEASKQKNDKLDKKVLQLTDTIKKAQVEVNKNFDAIKKQFAAHSQQRMQKMQQTYDQTISDLQIALKAKEDEINVVNKLRVEQRDMFKQEQALMASSFYEIGMEMSRMWNMNSNRSISNVGSTVSVNASSWLAMQRAKQ